LDYQLQRKSENTHRSSQLFLRELNYPRIVCPTQLTVFHINHS
jgi:hypothetical protein